MYIIFIAILLCVGPFIVLSVIPMIRNKIPPNDFNGVRTKKLCTPGNEELWYKANKYGGQQLLIAGVISTVCMTLMLALEEIIPAAVEVILFCIGFGAVFVAVIRTLLYVKKL